MKKIHFECSKCGADLNVDDLSKIIKCEYCGKKYLFEKDSDKSLIQEKPEVPILNSENKSNLDLEEEPFFSENRNIIEDKSKNQDLIYAFTSFGVIILFQFVVFIVFKLSDPNFSWWSMPVVKLSDPNFSWWAMPFLVTFLTGIICPAMGTFFVSKKRLLKPYSISLAVLPALSISLGLGFSSFFVIFSFALIISLAFEMPFYQRRENKIEVMIAIFTAIIGSGELLYQKWSNK